MKVSEILATVRTKLKEPSTDNTKYTDDTIIDAINSVWKRLHRKMVASNPQAFRVTKDVVLPATQHEVQIDWPRPGMPQVLGNVYDVTDDEDPGVAMILIPRSSQGEIDGIGVSGKTLWTTKHYDSDRTFRIILCETAQPVVCSWSSSTHTDANLVRDDEPPIPLDYQEDVFVYGTLIQLREDEAVDFPSMWQARYQEAETTLMRFVRKQTFGQEPRYGERYFNQRLIRGMSYV
jgi:hypothetical protein